MMLRSSITPRDSPDQDKTIDPKYIRCICCGQARVLVKRVKRSEKFAISTDAAAAIFLKKHNS